MDMATISKPIEAKQTKHYPSIYLSEKMPKGIMDKDVGDMVIMMVKAKICQKGIDMHENKEMPNMRLEIHDMEMMKEKNNETKHFNTNIRY